MKLLKRCIFILKWVIASAIFAAFSFLSVYYFIHFNLGDLIDFIGLLILGYWLSITFHELGHFFAGLVHGYRFLLLRVGGLSIYRSKLKIKMKWNFRQVASGQCLMIPPGEYPSLKSLLHYNAGGIMMNLVLAASVLTAGLFYDNHLVRAVMMYLLLINVFLLFINGNPDNIGTDGYNHLAIKHDIEARRSVITQIKVMKALLDEKPLRTFTPDIFKTQSDALDNPMIQYMKVMEILCLIFHQRNDEAFLRLDLLIKDERIMLSSYSRQLSSEYFYLQLTLGKNPDRAQQFYHHQFREWWNTGKYDCEYLRIFITYLVKNNYPLSKIEVCVNLFNNSKEYSEYIGIFEDESFLVSNIIENI